MAFIGRGSGVPTDLARAGASPVAPPIEAARRLSATSGDSGITVLVAGDVGDCDGGGDEATAALLADRPDAPILVPGDLAYPAGRAEDFARCFGSSWGAFTSRMFPAPGNHEYLTAEAAPYFDYFGSRAGTRGRGYYSFELGDWHLIALNSERDTSASGAQVRWLRADLAAHPAECVLAFWHKPRFDAGEYSDLLDAQVFWTVLADARADVILNGHDHNYQRFQPLDASGRADPEGLREFVVGTGGKQRYALKPDSRRDAGSGEAWGILELKLRPRGYDWRFVPVAGASYEDSGSGSCH